MKNFIFAILLFTVFISSNNTQAYSTIYPGSILNPLQIQIVPQPGDRLDALIQQQNQEKLLLQQQQYQQQLLDIQRKQLELQQNQQYNQRFQQESLINNQACPNKYGLNSVWNGLFIGGGSIICDCKSGYQWNQGQTECISIPSKVISNGGESGGGSKSTITCNGKEWNNCPVGQKFSCPSTGDAQCLITPKAVTPIPKKELAPAIEKVETDSEKKINDDICKSIDLNSYHNSKLSRGGYPACRCVSGYIRLKSEDPCVIDTNVVVSNNQDSKITTSTAEIKSKSFWTKLKGWLGF